MECDICQLKWSDGNLIPRILPCGHTFCQSCINNQIIENCKKNEIFKCQLCKKEIPSLTSKKDVLKLRKNYALISLTDKVQTYVNVSNTTIQRSFLANYKIVPEKNNDDEDNNIRNKNNKNDKNENNLKFSFPQCQNHKKIAIFYNMVNGNKNFFCDDCFKTSIIQNPKPMPYLKTQDDFKIYSCKNKIKILREEITRIENFLTSYQTNFETNNKQKIDELFSYINKIIQYCYTTAKTLFNQCQREQKIQIEKKISELSFLNKELDTYEKNLKDFSKKFCIKKQEPDPESQISLDNIFCKLGNFINYENELNLFQMNISIKEENKDSLFDIIQDIYKIDVDFLKMENGELPTVKALLNKNSKWPCDCGVLDNEIGKIVCSGCSKYRPLETYNNLIFNSLLAEKSEIKEFNIRRKHELKVYQILLNKKTDDLKNIYYFAIDANWYNKWNCFVHDDLTQNILNNYQKNISDNKKINVLPPGIINNNDIYEAKKNEKGYKLKNGLIKEKDFYIINQFLWEWFLLNYSGGPEIRLTEKDVEMINKNEESFENKENKKENNKLIFSESSSNSNHSLMMIDSVDQHVSVNSYIVENQKENNNDNNLKNSFNEDSII